MHVKPAIACLIAAVGSASSVHADPRRVDEDVAVGLSAGGTAAAYALAAYCSQGAFRPDRWCRVGRPVAGVGVLIAPSLGHWYVEDWWTRGLGLRVLGLGVGLLAYAPASTAHDEETGISTGKVLAAVALAAVGGALIVWGTIDDLWTVRDRAREYNAVVAPLVVGRF